MSALAAPLNLVLLLAMSLLWRRLGRAEDAIESLLRGNGRIGANPRPSEEVAALARRGETVLAIRLYRQQSGADLRRARLVVEELASVEHAA